MDPNGADHLERASSFTCCSTILFFSTFQTSFSLNMLDKMPSGRVLLDFIVVPYGALC